MARKNPNSNKKSGGAGFIITLLILAAVTNFSFAGIVAGVLLGLGIGKITSIMGSGLDTTTHNSRDRAREQEEAEQARRDEEAARVRMQQEAERRKKQEASTIPLTGDKTADQVITTGQEMLNTIKRENAAIPDRELTDLMDEVLPYVTTDMSNADILSLLYTVAANRMGIAGTYRIPIDGSYTEESIYGMAVLVPDLEQNSEYLQRIIYGK